MLAQPAIATLNHLFAQSGWALPRLAKFQGRTVRFRSVLFVLTCTIEESGLLREAAPDASADAELNIAPSLLPRLALNDEQALDLIETIGDGALLEEIFFLARNLRWDAAEDISRFTGDIAAERIVGFAQRVHKSVRDAALNLSQAAAEYWTEERPLIAKSTHLAEFGREVGRMREEVERLEQRINDLNRFS